MEFGSVRWRSVSTGPTDAVIVTITTEIGIAAETAMIDGFANTITAATTIGGTAAERTTMKGASGLEGPTPLFAAI